MEGLVPDPVYVDLVYRAYVDFLGHAWPLYDEAFCMCVATHPSLCWNEQNFLLWLQLARTIIGKHYDRGNLVHKVGKSNVFCHLVWQSVQSCLKFSSQGSCKKRPSKFNHGCSICGGPHSFIRCLKGQPNMDVKGVRRREEAPGRVFNPPRGARMS